MVRQQRAEQLTLLQGAAGHEQTITDISFAHVDAAAMVDQ